MANRGKWLEKHFNFNSGSSQALRRVGVITLVAALIAIAVNNELMRQYPASYPQSLSKLVLDALSNALVVICSSAFVASIRLHATSRHENETLLADMETRFTILQERNVAYVRVHDSLNFNYIREFVLTEGDTLRIMVSWQANWIERHYFRGALKKVNLEILMFAPESQQNPGAPNEFVTERQIEIGRKDDPTWGMDQIRSIQRELEDTIKSTKSNNEYKTIIYKFLHGTVRTPIYLIKRGDKVVRAFTGFYCDLSDEHNLFLEWFLPSIPLSDEKASKTSEFLKGLDEYFEMKWAQGELPSITTTTTQSPPSSTTGVGFPPTGTGP